LASIVLNHLPMDLAAVSWIDLLGYAASLLVLTTFCMSTMLRLRWVAIGSNVLFILFGYFGHIYPVMILHIILLPVNVIRLTQIYRLGRSVARSDGEGLSVESLLPFMTRRNLPAGTTLITKGDPADKLYYLMEGQIEIVEIGKTLGPGPVISEIGVFAPDHRRTATVVVCATDYIFRTRASVMRSCSDHRPALGEPTLRVCRGGEHSTGQHCRRIDAIARG